MGIITYANTAKLIEKLKNDFSINLVIETGTDKGVGTFFLAERFQQVITIDISKEFQDEVQKKSQFTNIEYVVGDSRTALPIVMQSVKASALFWLDAHQTNKNFGDFPDDCPIIEEIESIVSSPFDHFILVDDVNSFLPSEKRHHQPACELENWVTIDQIKSMLENSSYVIRANLDHDAMIIIKEKYVDECIGLYEDII